MFFSPSELALMNFALHTTPEKNQDGQFLPRQLSIDEIEDGVAINKFIKASIENDKFIGGDHENIQLSRNGRCSARSRVVEHGIF